MLVLRASLPPPLPLLLLLSQISGGWCGQDKRSPHNRLSLLLLSVLALFSSSTEEEFGKIPRSVRHLPQSELLLPLPRVPLPSAARNVVILAL